MIRGKKTPASAREVLADLWQHVGGEPQALEPVAFTGEEPVLPSSFRVATAAQVSIAAAALAAAELHRQRGGPRQQVSVDKSHAAVEFKSENHFRIDDGAPPALWDAIAGTYRCGDGSWVRIHTNFPHHRDGILAILQCKNDRESVANALRQWNGQAFENEAVRRGVIAVLMRGVAQWDQHLQGVAIAKEALLTIQQIGAAPPELPALGARPLEQVRVLDLTRIIAGPVAGRTLSAHGAEVLLVTSEHLPSVAPLVIDTGRGKRSANLDLRNPS